MIYLKLLLSFIKVGTFSIGGGYAAIPLIQSQVVDINSWISLNDFSNLIAIAEMTPGPIAINTATFVGVEIAGIKGALIATLGCIIPSLIIVTFIGGIYFKYSDIYFIKNTIKTVRPIIVAVIASAGLTLLLNTLNINDFNINNLNYLYLILSIIAFILLQIKKINPILIMSSCGLISLIVNSLF